MVDATSRPTGTSNDFSFEVSNAGLSEANRRLYRLREAVQAGRDPVPGPRPPTPSPRLTGKLPAHLGWHSPAVTRAIRAQPSPFDHQQPSTSNRPPTTNNRSPIPVPRPQTIKLYPDLALGMLHKDLAAPGRIWLLLRYLDREGRGSLRIDLIEEQLTGKNSKLRVCGRRQLRNLLKQGRGIFWERDKERLWLKSVARVAEVLEVRRLTGMPVELPVAVLLGGIGRVRAHLYASFHSGRRSDGPISRAKLARLTHVPERTQRVYEQATGVTVRSNMAVGPHSEKEVQERAWRHGRAVFEFVDKEGKQGPAGGRYLAWQLPNNYEGCHEQSAKGRQKKTNRQIDLVASGAQGNGLEREGSQERSSKGVGRIFHAGGLEAGKAYNRDGCDDHYWPASRTRPKGSRPRLWRVMGGRRRRS